MNNGGQELGHAHQSIGWEHSHLGSDSTIQRMKQLFDFSKVNSRKLYQKFRKQIQLLYAVIQDLSVATNKK